MKKPRTSPARPSRAKPAFTPATTRARHDGWTPVRQTGFVEALAESGCVREASASIGISVQSAYRLRARVDAQGFRMAWDAALDFAIRRLSDEVYSRALNGVPVPHFYQGEKIGEHRRYDERLALFLLRYRDPLRYAATLDQMVYTGHAEQAAIAFAKARDTLAEQAHAVADEAIGAPCAPLPPPTPPFRREPVREALPRQRAELEAAARAAAQARGIADHRQQEEDARTFGQAAGIAPRPAPADWPRGHRGVT